MNLSLISNVLLILVVIGVIAVRQMTWRSVLGSRDWMLPGIAAAIGTALLLQSMNGSTPGIIDVVAFVVEAVIAVAIGVAMGLIARIRPIERAEAAPAVGGASARELARAAARYETRTGAWGLALWVVMIAVRVGLSFAFASFGSHLGASTGLILLMISANRAARVLVLHARVDTLHRAGSRGGSRRIMVS